MSSVAKPLTVALVNDFPVVTVGVAGLLEPFRNRVRVEEYPGRLPPPGRVDVILFDPFGRPDPLNRLREIVRSTDAAVLIYAWAVTQGQIDDSVTAGASGFLSKTTDGATVVTALEEVASGNTTISEPASDSPLMPAWPGQSEGLSPRESEILALIVLGMSNVDIADATYLSINSVKTYIRTGYRKMGVATRTQAMVWGFHHGFETAARSVPSSPTGH